MTPFASVAMLEKLALLKIARCSAPALSSASSACLFKVTSPALSKTPALDLVATLPLAMRVGPFIASSSRSGPARRHARSARSGCRLRTRRSGSPLAVAHVGEQTAQFLLDHVVALAHAKLQSGALEHCNVAAAAANETGLLQFPGGLGNAFAAHA